MQENVEHTPPSSPRKLEEQRLRKETNGIFAPAAKPGFFTEKRKELVEEYVRKGMQKYDEQQKQQEEERKEFIFEIDM